ncbi:MAG: tyrosine-type recombinase/integrase [Brevinema sp.]
MGLYQRENGVYYICKTIKGRTYRVSLQTTDRLEAKDFHDLWLRDFRTRSLKGEITFTAPPRQKTAYNGQDITLDGNRPTLIQAFNEHIRICENNNISVGHLKCKKRIKGILSHLGFTWDHLIQERILDLQDKLKKDFSPFTASKLITALKAFLNYCIKQNYFNAHDYKRLDFMKRPNPKLPRISITDEDIIKIINYLIEHHDIDMLKYITVLYTTGSRPYEITTLKVSDIDLENEMISIMQHKVKRSKNIKVPQEVLEDLIRYAKITDHPEGYIFYGINKNKEFYQRKFKSIIKNLGLNPRYSLYKYRHSVATKLIQKYNLAQVQQLLGHKDSRTTVNHYISNEPKFVEPLTLELLEGMSKR